MISSFRIFLSLIVLLFILSCSSDDSAKTKVGIFIDSPVEGLEYETLWYSGQTNSDGKFKYKDGQKIKFKIGDIILGEVIAQEQMSPYTLAGLEDFNDTSSKEFNKTKNIARLLQNLASNKGDGDLIKLSLNLKKLKLDNFNQSDLFKDEASFSTILDEILKEANNTETDNSKKIYNSNISYTDSLKNMKKYLIKKKFGVSSNYTVSIKSKSLNSNFSNTETQLIINIDKNNTQELNRTAQIEFRDKNITDSVIRVKSNITLDGQKGRIYGDVNTTIEEGDINITKFFVDLYILPPNIIKGNITLAFDGQDFNFTDDSTIFEVIKDKVKRDKFKFKQ